MQLREHPYSLEIHGIDHLFPWLSPRSFMVLMHWKVTPSTSLVSTARRESVKEPRPSILTPSLRRSCLLTCWMVWAQKLLLMKKCISSQEFLPEKNKTQKHVLENWSDRWRTVTLQGFFPLSIVLITSQL
jgi:hypothetical protein